MGSRFCNNLFQAFYSCFPLPLELKKIFVTPTIKNLLFRMWTLPSKLSVEWKKRTQWKPALFYFRNFQRPLALLKFDFWKDPPRCGTKNISFVGAVNSSNLKKSFSNKNIRDQKVCEMGTTWGDAHSTPASHNVTSTSAQVSHPTRTL